MKENTTRRSLFRMSIKLQRKGGIKHHSSTNTNTIPSNAFKREIYSKNKLEDITFSSEEEENFFSIDQSHSLATSPYPSVSPSNISENSPFIISTLAPSIMPSRFPIDFPTYRSCEYRGEDVTKEIIKFDYEVIIAKQVDANYALREVEQGLFQDVSDSLLNCNVRMLSNILGNSIEEGNVGSLIAIDSKPLDMIDQEQSKCHKPMLISNPGPCIRINGALTTTTCSACISPKAEVLETIKQGMFQKKFLSEKVLQVSFVGENTNQHASDNVGNHPKSSETSYSSKGKKLVLGGIVVISIGVFVGILLLVKLARWKKFQRRIRRKRLEEDNERPGERVNGDDMSNTTIVTDEHYGDISPCCSSLTVTTSLEHDTREDMNHLPCSRSSEMGHNISFNDTVRKHQKDNTHTCPITRIGANSKNNFSFDAKPPSAILKNIPAETSLEHILDSIDENIQGDDKSLSPKSFDPNNVSTRSERSDRGGYSKQSDPEDDLLGLSVLSDSTMEKVVTGSIASTASHLYCISPSFSYRTHESIINTISSPEQDNAVQNFSSPDTQLSHQPRVDIYISPSIINSLSSTKIGTPPTPSSNHYHSRGDDNTNKPSSPTLAQDDVEFSSPNFSLSTFSGGPMNFDSSMGSSSNESSQNTFARQKIEDRKMFWATDASFNEKRDI